MKAMAPKAMLMSVPATATWDAALSNPVGDGVAPVRLALPGFVAPGSQEPVPLAEGAVELGVVDADLASSMLIRTLSQPSTMSSKRERPENNEHFTFVYRLREMITYHHTNTVYSQLRIRPCTHATSQLQ